MPLNYQRTLFGLTLAQQAFDSWLNHRQIARLAHKAVPEKLQPYFALLNVKSDGAESVASTFQASQRYLLDKLRFGQLASLLDLAESAVIFTTLVSAAVGSPKNPISGLKIIWDYADTFSFVAHRGEIVHSLAFVTLLSLVGMVTSIPASLYRTFVLEEKHGFNKTSFKTWSLDLVKSTLLSAVLGLPLIAALLKIISYAGPSFVSWVMIFVIILQIIMIPAYPYLIAPIFNKFKALKDFQDKENYVDVLRRTQALAKRLNFPLGKVWVVDGSTRSSHSNAYFLGLPYLTKHIVLYDTLLDQSTPAEVEAVLAHELGHWKLNHSLRMMGMSQLILLVNLLMIRLSIFNPALYRSFSFTQEHPLIIGLLVSTSLLTPLDTITSFLVHAISRRFEFQADKFAFDLSTPEHQYSEELKMALVKLGNENKSVTDVDPIWSAYKHSHPTMPERIIRLDELIRAEQKKQ